MTLKTFDIDLFSKTHINPNLLVVAGSGAGKSTLFKRIINQEHCNYAETIRSIVFTSFSGEYEQGLSVAPTVKYLELFSINPFDVYIKTDDFYEQSTIAVVKSLFKTVAEELGIT